MYKHLTDLAQFGRITADVRPAESRPGGPGGAAMLTITTSMVRPMTIGGGVVQWSGWFNSDADDQHVDALNVLLRIVADLFNEAGRTAAIVRNALEDRNAARRAQRIAEDRLERVLHGRTPAFGEILVRVDPHNGSAWLLDPVRKDAGFGLHFQSLAELWIAHPELRPIRWGADGEGPVLIVAPLALPEPDAQ